MAVSRADNFFLYLQISCTDAYFIELNAGSLT